MSGLVKALTAKRNVKRPFGVTILAILGVIASVWLIFTGYGIASIGYQIVETLSIVAKFTLAQAGVATTYTAPYGWSMMLGSLIPLGVALLLWRLNKIGWGVTLVLCALGALGSIPSLITTITAGEVYSIAYGVVSIAINVAIAWYLTRKNVMQAFDAPRVW